MEPLSPRPSHRLGGPWKVPDSVDESGWSNTHFGEQGGGLQPAQGQQGAVGGKAPTLDAGKGI